MANRLKWLLASILGAGLLALTTLVVPGRAVPNTELGSIIVSEVAWAGTAGGYWLEWIELYNRTDSPVEVNGWQLTNEEGIIITLQGAIGAGDFYLLERHEGAVADFSADLLFGVALNDLGDSLWLWDDQGQNVDGANTDGGAWPAGTSQPPIRSMERTDPDFIDLDSNWSNNDGQTRNGADHLGNPIYGTPKKANSAWSLITGTPDLFVQKTGPITATAGNQLQYSLQYGNIGEAVGESAILTDLLPIGLSYISDTSGIPLVHADARTLVWQVGDLSIDSDSSFQLLLQSDAMITGAISNNITLGLVENEIVVSNNHASATTQFNGSGGMRVLIDAVYYDTNETFEPDEAIRLINAGPTTVDISGWRIGDGESEVTLPENTYLKPHNQIWASKNASAFTRQFGFEPDFAVESENSLAKLLSGSWPRLSNNGDEVILRDSDGQIIDVMVYKQGDNLTAGWHGSSVLPYALTGVFGEEGQILFRKRGQTDGLPVVDTDSVADWAQDFGDPINGRRVQYPGWDIGKFFFPARQIEKAEVIVGITPDNGYQLILNEVERANSSIKMEIHTMTHLGLASALSDASRRGVSVTVLLEGSPVGGIKPEQFQACDLLSQAGGRCWYMISDSDQDIHDRYRYLHAKVMIIDGLRAVISSENLSPNSLPDDDKSDGTLGRRGIILVTNATSVVDRLEAIWDLDFDPENHIDIVDHTKISTGASHFASREGILDANSQISYTVRFSEPTTFTGTFSFELIQSPENSLRDVDGIINLINQTGLADSILVEQLTERPHWGSGTSSSETDPNPRLMAYLASARRGAKVRILLDSYFASSEEINPNSETCDVVNSIAEEESLDLACELGNPTGLGIHNKMILVQHDGQGYAYVGSINGSELSHKGNREIGLILSSTRVYNLLAEMFEYDWPNRNYLPLIYNQYIPPADHVLVTEVLYDPSGREEAEFIELVNPTFTTIDLSGFSLGDAVNRDDFEDVRRFPAGSILLPNGIFVVALTASGFRAEFGFDPDFEIVDSSNHVPDLIDDPSWGHPAALLRLGNQGDEIILRNLNDQIVDGIAYGNGNLPETVACSAVIGSDYSLERVPYWRDTDDCPFDFREWPFPNPGWLP